VYLPEPSVDSDTHLSLFASPIDIGGIHPYVPQDEEENLHLATPPGVVHIRVGHPSCFMPFKPTTYTSVGVKLKKKVFI
jgi:hypothetical protein